MVVILAREPGRLNSGHIEHIEQLGTPEDSYERPATSFVLEFTGRVNVFAGEFGVQEGRPVGSPALLAQYRVPWFDYSPVRAGTAGSP